MPESPVPDMNTLPDPPASQPAASAATVPAAGAHAGRGEVSMVRRAWAVFQREPVLLVTCCYLFISAYGLWDSYWYYRRFQIPILEFMQSSDYFVSGLRRPVYVFLLGWALLSSWLTLMPERWRQRHPDRVSEIERRWWGRLLLPKRSDWWMYMGLHPETFAAAGAIMVMGGAMYAHSSAVAERVHDGGGHAVSVQLAGQEGALAGDWRMLGTSSAFMFVWNPVELRAEVLPIDSVASVRLLGRRSPAPEAAAPPAAPDAAGR
jgi:hypothetical protein